MSIAPVQGSTTFAPLPNIAAAPSAPASSGFLDTLGSAIRATATAQSDAEQKVRSMLSGDGQDVHAATLAVEQANLSFELMVQVRNKVVNAYQEISRLQF